MEDCLFCKIIKGEIPSKKIYDDEYCTAFLDINPANPGHTLVVPKQHSQTIYEIDERVLSRTIIAVKKIAQNLKDKMNADGINVIQNNGREAGQIVYHFHFHVIPRFKNDNVIITYPKADVEEKDFEEIQKKLKEDKKDPYE
jgi:histidine triad (HIT) family protein